MKTPEHAHTRRAKRSRSLIVLVCAQLVCIVCVAVLLTTVFNVSIGSAHALPGRSAVTAQGALNPNWKTPTPQQHQGGNNHGGHGGGGHAGPPPSKPPLPPMMPPTGSDPFAQP